MARAIYKAILVVVVALGVATLQSTEATDYQVGDSAGWSNPSSATFYSSWASNHNFAVGDILIFNFATNSHDVATVTKDAYDNCNTANTITTIRIGPATILLNATGEHYYMCTFSGHCSAGQKLFINVTSSASSTPSPGSPPGTVTPPPPPPPPPPPSSSLASSLVATFVLMFMSIAMGFMCYF